jgi:hypothetical protein
LEKLLKETIGKYGEDADKIQSFLSNNGTVYTIDGIINGVITPTARSTTLPRLASSSNSFMMDMVAFLSGVEVHTEHAKKLLKKQAPEKRG